MGDISGLALVAEIAVMVAYFVTFDPNDYVIARRNSEDWWYVDLQTAIESPAAANLISNPDFTKAQAIADSDATVDDMVHRFGVDNFPAFYQAQCTANGYNSTAAALLANDASAQAISAAAKVKLQAITQYAGISSANINSMVNLLAVGRGTSGVVSVSSAPFGTSLGELFNTAITSVGQNAGAVDATVNLTGSVASSFSGGLFS